MLETLRHIPFRAKEIWFADMPYEVGGCELLEFRDCKRKVNTSVFKRSEAQTLVIDLTQDLDAIWHKFDKKSCRYEIKRAEREGIKCGAWVDERFFEMNRNFRHAKHLGRGPSASYIVNYGTLFVAMIGEEILAGQVYLEDEATIRWLVGASEGSNPIVSAANRAITWAAIQYAKEQGTKEFDFGGYDETKYPTISFFKRSFGGKLVTRYNYSKWCLPSVVTDTARRINDRLHGLDFSVVESSVEGHHSSPSGDKYLEDCLRGIGIKDTDTILDVGCGKGSAMVTMLKFPFLRVDGVDVSIDIVRAAIRNTRKYRKRAWLMNRDARDFIRYHHYNVIYFYNPFPAGVMAEVMKRIEVAHQNMTIIYNNPICHEEIVRSGIFHKVAEYPNRWGTGINVYTNSRPA